MREKLTARELLMFVILFLTILLFISSYTTLKSERKEYKELIEKAYKDTQFYKDELGREVARSEAIRSTNLEEFASLVFENPAMIKLQEEVAFSADKLKRGGHVTVIYQEQKIEKEVETEVEKDSITGDLFYKSHYKDEWIDLKTLAGPLTTHFTLETKDILTNVIGFEKDKNLPWLRRQFSDPVPYSWTTSESPYSTIKESKTFTKLEKPFPKNSFSIIAGPGYSITSGEFGVFVGVGYSRRIFSF